MPNTMSGREPVTIVEIDQPICAWTYGVAPCTAALSSAFPNKCFNTRKTCQSTANFSLAVNPLTIRFCRAMENVPKSWNAIPCLDGVTTTPTQINPGGSSRDRGALGSRASCQITMIDLPSSDLKVDPYQDERISGAAQVSGAGYNPIDYGTFWTKWLRRNPYYINWKIRIRDGYISQNPDEMITRNYIIEDIDGPGPDGTITIKAQDIFAMADNAKAQCPNVSQGILNADITAVAASIPIKDWEVGEYPTAGTVRIGDECITYTNQNIVGSILTLTGATRGTDGTTAKGHDEDDSVQLCYRVADADNVYCWEVVQDLLENYAGIPTEYIPFADWQTEGTTWLPTFTVTTLITQPTGVATLVAELCQQCLFDLWWDERDQEIKFRALRAPTETPTELNDRQHIIAGSWKFKSDMTQRVSQIWVYYKQKNPTISLSETNNYKLVRIRMDPSLESDIKYGEPRIKIIYSRWLESDAQAIQLSTRYMGRYQDGAKYLKIRCDAKDRDLWTGSIVQVTIHSMVDDVGIPEKKGWQVVSAEEIVPGEIVEYNLQNYYFIGTRYAYYMDVINCRSAAGQWTASAHGTNEYYFDNSGGLLIAEPAACYINEPTFMTGSTKGVLGALAAGNWGWGNNDALGYNTVYVRLSDGTDPDTKAAGYVTVDYPTYTNLPDKDVPPQGAWWSDDDGLMSDLTNGWMLQ